MSKKLSYEEKQELVRRIISGKLFLLDDQELIELLDPNQEDLYKASIVYKNHYDKFVDNGIMTLKESFTKLIDLGRWNKTKEDRLSDIEFSLGKDKPQLENMQKADPRYEDLEKHIKNLELEEKRLRAEKYQFYSSTAEYAAERKKRSFLAPIIGKNTNKVPNWVIDQYFNKDIITTNDIRQIARSEPWRTNWGMIKNGSVSIVDACKNLTEYQLVLCEWSFVYDYVFESSDKPKDLNINNDAEVDAFLSRGSTRTKVIEKHSDYSIVETFRPAKDAKEAQKIYSGNTVSARKRIKEIVEKTKQKKEFEDAELSSVKQDMQIAARNKKR